MLADSIHESFAPTRVARPKADRDALLIDRGRVVAVGSAAELASRSPGAALLDLRGCTITPGFVDSHLHFIEWALGRDDVDLAPEATVESAMEAIAAHARSTRTTRDWVTGRGWSGNRWGGRPDREFLDSIVDDRPAAFQSQDMHGLWVNSRALEVAGITDSTPDPQGGAIVRDACGRATGVLLESAMARVQSRMPVRSHREIARAVCDAQSALHAFGITGIHSFPAVNAQDPADLRMLREIADAGELLLRVVQQIPVSYLDAAIELNLRSGMGDDWVRIGGIKMFLDGSLGSRTAWLSEPYNGGTDLGMSFYTAASFRDVVSRAARAGLATTVHAIGDAAVSLAFEVLTDPTLARTAMPHRVEHVQLCPRGGLIVPHDSGVVCSVQPTHIMADWRAADDLWGGSRCGGAYAFRSLLDAGAVLAFGSDGPVASPDPRHGLFAATARQDLESEPAGGWYPQQRISTKEALWGYTGGAALAGGAAGLHGQLIPGAFADFAAWNCDPLELHGRDFLHLECRATAIGGTIVWSEIP